MVSTHDAHSADFRPDHPARRISGSAELLQAVPYLLGFHPRDSLVLVGMRADAESWRVVVTGRLDLGDWHVRGAGLLADVIGVLVNGGASHFAAVVFDDVSEMSEAGFPPHGPLVDDLVDEGDRAGCVLMDAHYVAAGRWRVYGCDDAACCPPGGHPLPTVPSEFVAAATYGGVAVLPDRAALAAVLEPCPDLERFLPLLEAAAGEAERVIEASGIAHYRSMAVRRLRAAARAGDVPAAPPPADAAAAGHLLALQQIDVRDALWTAMEQRRIDGRTLWADLARRAPGPTAAPALFLYGWASWRHGNGAAARVAVDLAVACDPGYTAADLLLAVLDNGVDPRTFPRLSVPRTRRRRPA